MKVIDLVAKGKSALIALSLGIGKTNPRHSCQEDIDYPILEGRNEWQNTISRCKNGNLNQLVWDWFIKARSQNFVVTSSILQKKARELAMEMEFSTFKVSNSCLQSFKKRDGAMLSMLSEEMTDVHNADVED